MKVRKNKKRYNFTEQQLRKDRSVKYSYGNNVPKWFVKEFNDKFKNRCKMILKNHALSYPIIMDNVVYPIQRHDAGWYWW